MVMRSKWDVASSSCMMLRAHAIRHNHSTATCEQQDTIPEGTVAQRRTYFRRCCTWASIIIKQWPHAVQTYLFFTYSSKLGNLAAPVLAFVFWPRICSWNRWVIKTSLEGGGTSQLLLTLPRLDLFRFLANNMPWVLLLCVCETWE